MPDASLIKDCEDFLLVPSTPESKAAFLAVRTAGSLFGAVSQNDENTNHLISRCLAKIFDGSDGSLLLQSKELSNILPNAAQHWCEAIRTVVLEALGRFLKDDAGVEIAVRHGWAPLFYSSLQDSSSRVVQIVSNALVETSKTQAGTAAFLQAPQMVLTLEKLLSTPNSVIRVRVLSVLGRMSASSTPAQSLIAKTPFHKVLTSELSSDDVLNRLSVLEIVNDMSASDVNPKSLHACLQAAQDDPLQFGSVMETCAKFLSKVGTSSIELSRLFESTCFRVLSSFQADLDAKQVTLGAMCDLFVSTNGRDVFKSSVPKLLKLLGEEIVSTTESLRVGAMVVVTKILAVGLGSSQDHDACKDVMESAMPRMMSCALSPSMNDHMNSMKLFTAMSTTSWGIRLLLHQQGFPEFAVNRGMESSKEGLEQKYELVQALLANKETTFAAGPRITQALKAYSAEGAFAGKSSVSFEAAIPAVATETR